jgi:hypothetical protein
MEDIAVGHLAKIGNDAYEVKYVTNPKRVLVDMGMGTLVGLDFVPVGGTFVWQLSGDPCNVEETKFIESQPGFGKTEVVVTKDPE